MSYTLNKILFIVKKQKQIKVVFCFFFILQVSKSMHGVRKTLSTDVGLLVWIVNYY